MYIALACLMGLGIAPEAQGLNATITNVLLGLGLAATGCAVIAGIIKYTNKLTTTKQQKLKERATDELFTAVRAGDVDATKRALENGAAINSNLCGLTPLHWACIGNYLTIVTLLLERGARRDAQDATGSTPLHLACEFGHLEIVKFLIENYCSVAFIEAQNKHRATPLQLASENGQIAVVTILLLWGNARITQATLDTLRPILTNSNIPNAPVVLQLLTTTYNEQQEHEQNTLPWGLIRQTQPRNKKIAGDTEVFSAWGTRLL